MYATDASTDREGNINVENKDIVNAEEYLNDLTGGSQNNLSKDIDHDNNTKNINLIFPDTGTQDPESLNVENAGYSEEQMACAYKRDELVQAIITAKVDGLRKLPGKILKKIKLLIGDFRVDRDKLYVKRRLYILDDNELKVCILR